MVIYGGNIIVEWTLDFIFSEPYYESVSDYEEIQEVEHFPASASPDSDDWYEEYHRRMALSKFNQYFSFTNSCFPHFKLT